MIQKRRALYLTPDGRAPFEDWLNILRDRATRIRIAMRINRAAVGNFGDHRSVRGGIIELRVHFGPGYRAYIGLHGHEILVLLCGGDKSTQDDDISRAHIYWEDFRSRL